MSNMAYAAAAVRAAPAIGEGNKRGRMAPARVQTGPMQFKPAPDWVLHRLVYSRTQAIYGLRLSVRATKNFSGDDYSKLMPEIKQAVAQQINEVAAANLAAKITPSAFALKPVYSQYMESNHQAVTYCIGVPGDELLLLGVRCFAQHPCMCARHTSNCYAPAFTRSSSAPPLFRHLFFALPCVSARVSDSRFAHTSGT